MLTWIASIFCAGFRGNARRMRQRGHNSLASLQRWVLQLVILRAAEMARPQRRRALFWRGRDQRRSQLVRALIGSAMRRAVRHRDTPARIGLLVGVLRNLDAYARRIAKRMRRRLTRLWPIVAQRAIAAPLPDAPLLQAAFADSS